MSAAVLDLRCRLSMQKCMCRAAAAVLHPANIYDLCRINSTGSLARFIEERRCHGSRLSAQSIVLTTDRYSVLL